MAQVAYEEMKKQYGLQAAETHSLAALLSGPTTK